MIFTYVVQIMQGFFFYGREKNFYHFYVEDSGSETKAIFMKVRDMVNSQERWLYIF